jgi:ATP-binding cassette subfamily C protein CydCD
VALVPTHSASANSAISFEGVGFAYGPGLPEALRDVSLKLESGQTVALVGRSGAGKTTCAQMLLRFWDPLSGRITLQGHDIRDFKLDALRRNIALVAQDTYLFNATIRENLRIAGQDTTDTDIERAAEMANATEFIDAMPDGYETPVGERGMQLSGGQRQRISIARALLKDAPMLILDEATSHLDAVNEQQIRQALERLMEGRTTLVIAHRLSTVRDADRIVVLDRGRVAEQGTHTELLANAGLYAQLVRTQIVSASGQAGQG